jgi:hypothetical protein
MRKNFGCLRKSSVLKRDFAVWSSFSFRQGPDAPQPVGLLCYPSVLDVPTFAASPSPRPSERWNCVGENHGQ